jgi:hypothetical protein
MKKYMLPFFYEESLYCMHQTYTWFFSSDASHAKTYSNFVRYINYTEQNYVLKLFL